MRSSWLALALMAVARASAAQTPANGLPAVSSDGRHIAFVGTRDGRDHLFVMDADGGNEHEVPVPSVDGRMPRWTSGGELLFSGAAGDTGQVFAVRLDGGARRTLASVPGRSPTLSPDGRGVLYLAGPWTSTALLAQDVDGTYARRLAGGGTTAWNGAWSPDGARVSYTYG